MNTCIAFLLAAFKVIAIPAQFQDCSFSASQAEIRTMLTNAEKYFNEQYNGSRTFQFDLAPVVTLQYNTDYYGHNSYDTRDVLLCEGVIEACKQAGESIDFSQYDNDGDGTADLVILITAGLSEADGTSEDNIWPQQDRLSQHKKYITIGETAIEDYLTVNELWSDCGAGARLNGIGNLCHEFGHTIGLPDYYDTFHITGTGKARAMWGSLALMDEGNRNDQGRTPPYFNALDLELLGLGNPEPLKAGSYVLEPIGRSQRYLKVETGNEGEFFLIEARDKKGRDAGIGGAGLVIYHIDRSRPQMPLWESNKVNSNPEHQNAYAIACLPDAEDVSQVFFPHQGHDRFTQGSEPSFTEWSGKEMPFAITDIRTSTNGNVSFNVLRPFTLEDPVAFQDAVLLKWEKDPSIENASTTVCWSYAGDVVDSLTTRDNFIIIDNLKPQRDYKIRLTAEYQGRRDLFATTSATTKARHLSAKSFIYFNGAERNPDGSFARGTRIPLRVFNVSDEKEVFWYADGKRIFPEPDGFLTLTKSITLKAEIIYPDSKRECLIKQITVR